MRRGPQDRKHRQTRRLNLLQVVLSLILMVLLSGCDPAYRHRVLHGLINGLPELPTPKKYCDDFDVAVAAAAKAKLAAAENVKPGMTMHPPYAEKRCNDCHNRDRDDQDGLIAPKRELCFICHPEILKGDRTHGPAADGDCVACHVPHSSSFPRLLDVEPTKLCAHCHAEKRKNERMHDRLVQRGFTCIDCHDPHSGSNKYFLK